MEDRINLKTPIYILWCLMLKSLSLFSGCAGLDSSVFQAGFTPLALAEIDPHATRTLSHWLGQKGLSVPIFSDVTKLNPAVLLEQLGLV
jgi:site-specific DNA-cytosine methylase